MGSLTPGSTVGSVAASDDLIVRLLRLAERLDDDWRHDPTPIMDAVAEIRLLRAQVDDFECVRQVDDALDHRD